jgi:CheY-like chemotaxis protein
MFRILIIDDDPDTRAFLEQVLSPAGYETLTAGEGEEGLKRYLSEAVDLVITDLFMPERDGLETIVDIRTRFPALPIIAISGHPPALLPAALAIGANETLQKPFSSDQLLASVQKLLPKRP